MEGLLGQSDSSTSHRELVGKVKTIHRSTAAQVQTSLENSLLESIPTAMRGDFIKT